MSVLFKNKGFTIVEAIIVTAVLAAVTVMAFPNFVGFFRMQQETIEQSAMAEIKDALEAYAEENGSLPSNANWVSELAPYASLSEGAIELDQWDQARSYHKITEVVNFRATNISVDYGAVYSEGIERGVGETGVNVDLPALLGDSSDYATLQAEYGDYLVKYTNYKQQVKNYEITEQRLKDISSALASYATTRFNEAVVAGTPNAEQFIYYPPTDDADLGSADAANYSNFALDDVDRITGNPLGTGYRLQTGSATDATRRDDMISLVRFLGLPDSHCCSALDQNQTPFYYYSNPRPRVGGVCGVRPGAAERKLPPRVRVEEDPCG